MDSDEVARREEARLNRSFHKKKSFSITPSFLSRRKSTSSDDHPKVPTPRPAFARSHSMSKEETEKMLEEKKIQDEKREREREEFERKEREMAQKRRELRNSQPVEKEEELSVLLRDAPTRERVRIARTFGKTHSLPVNFRNDVVQEKIRLQKEKEQKEKEKKAKEDEELTKMKAVLAEEKKKAKEEEEKEERKKAEEEKKKAEDKKAEEDKKKKEQQDQKQQEIEAQKKKEDEAKKAQEEKEQRAKAEQEQRVKAEQLKAEQAKVEEAKTEQVKTEETPKGKELQVTIHYTCEFGQQVALVSSALASPVGLIWHEGHNWKGSISLDKSVDKMSYHYIITNDAGDVLREEEGRHEVALGSPLVSAEDQWI